MPMLASNAVSNVTLPITTSFHYFPNAVPKFVNDKLEFGVDEIHS